MMMLPDDKRTWYVVFTPKSPLRLRWYHMFLKKDFGHVYAISHVAGGVLKVDHTIWGTSIIHTNTLSVEQWLELAKPHATAILEVRVDYGRVPLDYIQRGLLSCVTVLKSIFALRRCRSFTPWGLYKYLMTCVDPSEAHVTITALKPYSPYCAQPKSVSQ